MASYKNTHSLTLLTHLLLTFCLPFLVSCQSWDGIIVTQSDFQALESFKLGLTDPNGFLKTWNDSGYGACSGGWEGIKCAQGQVIVIQLPWRGLGGQLSSKIGQLQALRKLSLHDNAIGGSIPKELGLLPDLRGIQLYNNRFTGSIPPTLGLCTLLQDLDFSNNSLVGGIPNTLWNCTVLNNVNLSFNSFTGSIDNEIGKLVVLKSLDLSHNSVNGSIPSSFSNLKSLSLLNLAHNNLNGQIPAFLGGQQNLTFLNVSYNNLSGHVPDHLSSKFDPSAFIGNLDLCGYSPSATCTASPPQSRHRRKNNKESLLIVAGALIAAFLLLCCIVLCCLLKKKDTRKQKDSEQGRVGPTGETPVEEEAAGAAAEGGGKLVHFEGGIEFTADDLLCATAEIIGKSTYGTVYRATLVAGNQVAVKRLRERIAKNQKEFKNEVNSLGKIRHPNLLAMRAYYLGPKGEKLLVFDYMPKGSLASFLHARGPNAPINWPTRMRIMKGMTRGLHNLHTQQNIIHGNLTSNNVLLDDDLNPKIGDYGLSRLMTTGANLNVIATAGALGYRAPELSKLKKANTKTDIYSLGVIILELLTGKSPGEVDDGVDLPQWVASIVKEEWTNEVFDLELMKDASVIGDELLNTLKLALHCVDPSPSARPEALLILQQLEEIRPEAVTSSGD